jgi:carboxylesterase
VSLGAPFDLPAAAPGDERAPGIVLVHGFTGTPYEMRYLGEALARQGFAVRGPRLPGHGTSLEDLDRQTWQDWAGAVDDAYDAMRRRHDLVAVIGQSLGGLLALCLGARRTEALAIGALAAPLWLPPLAARVARATQRGWLRRVRRLPKLGGSDVRDRRVRAENPAYPAIPTRALGQLLALMEVTDAALPALARPGAPPVLVLHGAEDHTAPVACAPYIAERAGATRLRILPRSYHLIAADVERDVVTAEVATFVTLAAAARRDMVAPRS